MASSQNEPLISIINTGDTTKNNTDTIKSSSLITTTPAVDTTKKAQTSPISIIPAADTTKTANPAPAEQPTLNMPAASSDAAKTDTLNATASTNPAVPPKPPYISPQFVPGPPGVKESRSFIFGAGAGVLNFWGDVNAPRFKPGYTIMVGKKLTPWLMGELNATFGKLEVNEQNYPRNINFQSKINSYGVNFTYNFEHLLPEEKYKIRPYARLGLEAFEFVSKTDRYDKYGNQYFYWNDGSIRNKAETASDANSAVVLKRDYKYETDIRELDLDGFGKYREQSINIPIGIGLQYQMLPQVSVRMGTTLNLTLTDYIDGVTSKSKGDRVGKTGTDKFFFSYISLHYDLIPPRVGLDTLGDGYFDDVDFLAFEKEDTDYDGVPDWQDSCQATSWAVKVDAMGCPPDDDGDNVANYKDQELNSAPGAKVNEFGVTLTDSVIKLAYLQYIDSTGQYSGALANHKPDYRSTIKGYADPNAYIEDDDLPPGPGFAPKEYTIQLDNPYKKGVPADVMAKLLSLQDIKSTGLEDSSTVYTSGGFRDYQNALKQKDEFVKAGFPNAKVVYKIGGKYVEAKGDETLVKIDPTIKKINNKNIQPNGDRTGITVITEDAPGVLRVQLGAYKRRMSRNVFPGVPELFEYKTEDGVYKYSTGTFTDIKEAAKRKLEMVMKGYEGAFITAYKSGKRVTVKSMGATPSIAPGKRKPVEEDITEKPGKTQSVINKKLVIFKVQVGVYKGTPPADVMAKMKKVDNLKTEATVTGLTRYTVGEFNSFEEASRLRDRMAMQGFDDAFIIAFFNGQYVTVQEAIELTK